MLIKNSCDCKQFLLLCNSWRYMLYSKNFRNSQPHMLSEYKSVIHILHLLSDTLALNLIVVAVYDITYILTFTVTYFGIGSVYVRIYGNFRN